MIVGSNGAIYRRAATPSSSASVTLKLKYLRSGLESGEYVAIQASANGGTTWTEVGRISGAGNDSSFHLEDLQHHGLPRPQYRDPFRGLDERDLPGRLRRLRRCRDLLHHHVRRRRPDAGRRERQAYLHTLGIKGRDIGVAVIDTGYWKLDSLDKDSAGNGRVAAQYDAINNVVVSNWAPVSTDTTGHGTHVTSLIASSRKKTSNGPYFGVAPDARIISIKAFGEDGSSTYATVIRAIDWVITNRHPLRHSNPESVARGPGAFALLGRSAQ